MLKISMKLINRFNLHIFLLLLLSVYSLESMAQYRKSQNLPFADQKLYHLGFNLGIHTQDMAITHTGYINENGEVWFSEIPSYSAGFSIGVIADRYLSQYFNLRVNPSVHFGEKRFKFIEQATGEIYEQSFKGNYFTIPLHLKFSGSRVRNFRPYLMAGPYFSVNIGNEKNKALRFSNTDYGLEFSLGCNIYLPYFKLCPEIKFSLGLADIINTNRDDLSDPDLFKYSNAISSGKNRMISLIFNFE